MCKKLDFVHDVTTEKKPWNHLNFRGGDGEDFSFAIVGDRTGRPEDGVFEASIAKANMLNPDFIISVGDFVRGFNVEDQSEEFIRMQWKEVTPVIDKSRTPFFYVVGNHDIPPQDSNWPGTHEMEEAVWKDLFGATYYSFIRKNVLFMCLHSTDPVEDIGEEQLAWALETLKKHEDVRWTMLFMHRPGTWNEPNFSKLEEALYHRNYTVFAGDLHMYTRYERNGRKYIQCGCCGGGYDVSTGSRGVNFGEVHHLTWVSFQDGEPKITTVELDKIHDDDWVTIKNLTYYTASYFRADKRPPKEELEALKKEGITVSQDELTDILHMYE